MKVEHNVVLEEWMTADGVTLILENALVNIAHEIMEDRLYGRVRPFVELSLPATDKHHRRRGLGEPIGTIKKRTPFKPPRYSAAYLAAVRQEELIALRRKNDNEIARILSRR